MKNNKIVLLTFYDLDSFAIHTLHAVLKAAGFDVRSVFFKSLNRNSSADKPAENEISALIKLLKDMDPFLVGISFRSTFFQLAKDITKEIKANLNVKIAWGGIHPTIKPAQCLEYADIVCVGEGEQAIVELATKLSRSEPYDSIQNLWVKKGSEAVKNDLRFLIQELDTLPFPDFLPDNKYFINGDIAHPLPPSAQRTDYSIMTSRGCPFSCTYCYNNISKELYKGKGKNIRRRSVENVIEELSQAKDNFKNLQYISFLDDLFTFNNEWVSKFSGQYKKKIGLPFYCHIHPKFANEDMIRTLKDAGCAGMTMGIQTGSENSRFKYYERFETNEQVVKSTQILHKYRINSTYDLIMDNPFETDGDKRETFNLLLQLPRPFKLCVHSLTHFPGTKLTSMLLSQGLITEADIEDSKQKAYSRWTPALDMERNSEDLFWDNLYYLNEKKYIPPGLLRWLSKLSLLKKHPRPLTFLLRLTSFSVYTIKSGSKLDTIRWAALTFLNKPYLIFKKRTWFFIWSKTVNLFKKSSNK